jgi:hypothetical protein
MIGMLLGGYKLPIIVAVSVIAGATINGWRLNAKIDNMVAEHSMAVQKATTEALNETVRMQKAKDEVIAQTQQEVQRNADAAAAVSRERDRLRNALTASRSALSESTPASVAKYAETVTTVFEQCTREYAEMAGIADKHATDTQLLFDTWTEIARVK